MAKGKKGRSGAARRAGTAESQSQNSTLGIVIGVVAVLAIVGLVAFFVSRNNSGSPASGGSGNCTEVNGETITTPSGLKYQDLTVCQGTPAKNGDRIAVHYTGSLENGTVFDSSFNRNQPFPFTLGQHEVIAGWDEGLLGMSVGSKRKLIIPANLGYGAAGSPPTIPANATLIFTVQVMGIN